MRPGRRERLFAAAAVFLLLWSAGPSSAWALRVAVSIAPLADLVGLIGGDDVEVVSLYPPGSGPPSIPLPDDAVNRAAGSLLYFRVGDILEGRSDNAAVRSLGKKAAVVEIAPAIDLIGPSKPEEAERKIFDAALGLDGTGGRGNPWFWLDPKMVVKAVDRITVALAEGSPERRDIFAGRAEDLKKQLLELDRKIEMRLANVEGRRFAAFSGVGSYFCRRYGLDEVAVTGVAPGGSPERTSLRGTVLLLQRLGVPAAFTGPSFPRRPAEEAAARAGIPLVFLEPYGSPGRGGYFEVMERFTDQVIDALSTQ